MEEMAMVVLFDLDGTLTDSGEGITKCAQLALQHFGIEIVDRSQLGSFVGPPLRESFQRYGIPPERVEEAITVFRGRYLSVGKFENYPYPGIREMLTQLKEEGHRLFVATSKPEITAVEVLEHFDLACYFERICGASMEAGRDSKDEVITYLLHQSGELEHAVMVGDTVYDVTGAAAHRIPTVGVRWGYGSVQEMLDAGACAIADNPKQLLTILQRKAVE